MKKRKLAVSYGPQVTEEFRQAVVEAIRDGFDTQLMLYGELRMRGLPQKALSLRLEEALNELVRTHRLERFDRGPDLVPGYRIVNLLETLARSAAEA